MPSSRILRKLGMRPPPKYIVNIVTKIMNFLNMRPFAARQYAQSSVMIRLSGSAPARIRSVFL